MKVVDARFLSFKHHAGDYVVHSVPYLVLDKPPEGWTSTLRMTDEYMDRLYWIISEYIPNSGVTEFDFFDDWSKEVDEQYQKYKEEENNE
ncbi:hypothetical protein BSP15_006 [Bacillus phage BSP15]|uniref:hypothetical protein n=1 Tax=Bacillus phage SPG24 TaxID=1497851 RepID=UPI0022BA2EF6|nr:hypothetical protein IM043_gp174 [Bacillus phage SPG24]AYJ74024.1 hypothetical protein BSP15_006 [Bacillus phage BSP15]AYJ75480.1 hypothetical protein BSP21_145 [Bacillus phage BSP21]